MAKSRSGVWFSYRQRLRTPPGRVLPYESGASRVHHRPVTADPRLFGEDGPARRVVTVAEENRIPTVRKELFTDQEWEQ